jgi:hypothetical protein
VRVWEHEKITDAVDRVLIALSTDQ